MELKYNFILGHKDTNLIVRFECGILRIIEHVLRGSSRQRPHAYRMYHTVCLPWTFSLSFLFKRQLWA